MLKKLQGWPILGPLVTFLDKVHPKVKAGSLVGLGVTVAFAVIDGLSSAPSLAALVATAFNAAAAWFKSSQTF